MHLIASIVAGDRWRYTEITNWTGVVVAVVHLTSKCPQRDFLTCGWNFSLTRLARFEIDRNEVIGSAKNASLGIRVRTL